MKSAFPFVPFLICARCAEAMILYGGGNDYNTTAPGNGAPWECVAGVYSSASAAAVHGSAVYLGDGYFITANHVSVNLGSTLVSLDGVNYLEVDSSFAAHQIKTVSNGVEHVADAKIFRVSDPVLNALQGVAVYDKFLVPQEGEPPIQVTLIGFGVGRANEESVGEDSATWGTKATAKKRWGLNDIALHGIFSGSGEHSTPATYSTILNNPESGEGYGADEAAMTNCDSGGGMFYFDEEEGLWYLVGLATSVTSAGSSNFGEGDGANPNAGDFNMFVDLSYYHDSILEIISVPETAQASLLAGMLALLAACMGIRKRKAR